MKESWNEAVRRRRGAGEAEQTEEVTRGWMEVIGGGGGYRGTCLGRSRKEER